MEGTRRTSRTYSMVLLYQLDCNKVLDMLEDSAAVSEEEFSDYWEKSMR